MKLNTRSAVVAVLALVAIVAAAVVIWPTNIPSASAVYPCTGIEVKSNLPTTWTITGPGGVSVVNPSGSAPSTGFATNKSSTGGIIPQGEYTIQVQTTVFGGRNPRFAWNVGSDSAMIGGSATFMCRGAWSHLTVNYGGVTEPGEVLQFQRTALDFDGVIASGNPGFGQGVSAAQRILWGAFVGNHFVFRGTWCRGDMHSQLGGTGLWSVSEDGTKIQERQQCIDAGSETNNPASISMNLNAGMKSSDGPDFLFTGSDLHGPRRTVYYGFSGDQVVIKSRSPLSFDGLFLTGYNGEGTPSLANGYVVDSKNGSTFRLSDWENVGISPVKSFFSLGDYLVKNINNQSLTGVIHVYKMQNGQVTDVGELPANIHALGFLGHAYDFSKSPTQLVVYDRGYLSRPGSGPSVQIPPRLIWYKAGSSSLELVKEMTLPSDLIATSLGLGGFAVWGDYVIWPRQDGVVVGKATGSTFTKIQTVVLPGRGHPTAILASTAGYVAVATESAQGTPSAQNPGAQRNQVHIYKFGGPSTSTPFVPPNPFPSSTLSQIPGQILTINTSVTPATVLARMANVLSVSSTSLNISIFGRTYTVDASRAKIYNMNWTLIPLSSFSPGSLVNVWGTLDPANPSLIRAINIRNPLPPGAQATSPTANPSAATTQTPASTAAMQGQLSTLQQALRALQLRLGQ